MKKVIIIIAAVIIALTAVSVYLLYNLGDKVINQAIDTELKQLEKELADEESLLVEQPAKPDAGKGNSKGNSGKNQGSKGTLSSEERKTSEDKIKKTKEAIEKIKKVKDDISAADKLRASTLVLKRLKASDISELKGMISGGLSSEEMARAKTIAYERFTPEEILEIKELYHKYMK